MKRQWMNAAAAMLMACATLATGASAWAGGQQDKAMTRMGDGTYVVNTSSLCANVKGYRAQTPLKIYIKNDKVERVEALKNQETPKYFSRVRDQVLPQWQGKSVKKAVKMKVNGVTGATMSSNAVKQNVKQGLEYYQTNK